MTKKEKFFQAIEQLGAKRVTEYEWTNAHGNEVWVAYHCGDVHIFNQPDGDEYFDHYIIGEEQCHWNNMVLCDIIYLTDLDGNDQPLCEDDRILLRTFATDDESLSDEETMHAIFLLWDNSDSIVNSITSSGWSQHESYEDDDETDYVAKMRLTPEQRQLIKKFEAVAKECKDAGITFVMSEYLMSAYNSTVYHIEWEPTEFVCADCGQMDEAMESVDFEYYDSNSCGEFIVKSLSPTLPKWGGRNEL